MPRLELFPFRFRDQVTGKWLRARYKASLADLEQRYGSGRYEIIGSPEIREVDPAARYFNPFRDGPDPGSIGNVRQILVISRPVERQAFPVAGVAT